MLALALLAAAGVTLWLSQAVLLCAAGRPLRLQIDAPALPPGLRRASRAITNLVLLAVLLAYPLLRGAWPSAYYAKLLPLGPHPRELAHGFALPALYLAALYLAWIITGQVHVRLVEDLRRLAPRLAALPLVAFFGAAAEELLFRGVLLAGLLEWLAPPSAVALGAVLFAAAHYLRRVKRYWTFPGHLALGAMLCVAFACTRSLWLPIGLHAGGIFVIMGLRPFVRSTGPAWLVGASIFPYAGVVGVAGLTLLTINVWLIYGVGS